MGAPKKTYERVAPPHSFIHVDDFVSPQKLAEYLNVLGEHDTLMIKKETMSILSLIIGANGRLLE